MNRDIVQVFFHKQLVFQTQKFTSEHTQTYYTLMRDTEFPFFHTDVLYSVYLPNTYYVANRWF